MDESAVLKSFKKNPNFVARMIDEEMILIPIHRDLTDLERFYVLNELARVIWELIDGKNSLGKIRNKIIKEFEVSKARAEEDLNKFIKELTEIGAIQEF